MSHVRFKLPEWALQLLVEMGESEYYENPKAIVEKAIREKLARESKLQKIRFELVPEIEKRLADLRELKGDRIIKKRYYKLPGER